MNLVLPGTYTSTNSVSLPIPGTSTSSVAGMGRLSDRKGEGSIASMVGELRQVGELVEPQRPESFL